MTIFFHCKETRSSLACVNQNPLHIHKTQAHNTQHFVCSTTLLSLSFSLLLVFLLQFRFATTPEEEAETQQQQQKISKSLESNIFYFQALGKRKRERERERFFLFSSFFFFFSVFGLAKDFLLLLDKTSSSSEVSLSFSLLHCLCFFLLKCIFHSSCLRLLFCSLLFCGFVRLNFTVWLLIRSFWGLDLTKELVFIREPFG